MGLILNKMSFERSQIDTRLFPLSVLPNYVETWGSNVPIGLYSGAAFMNWYPEGTWTTSAGAGVVYFTGGPPTPQSGTWKTGNPDASLYEIRWTAISSSPTNGSSIMLDNPNTWLSMNQFLNIGVSVVGAGVSNFTTLKFEIRSVVTEEILATMNNYLRAQT